MDIKIDQKAIERQVTDKVIDWFVDEDKILDKIRDGIESRIDAIFSDKATDLIKTATETAFTDAFERTYQKVDSFGQKKGHQTTIKKELESIVSSYWSEKVDNNGNPISNSYSNRSQTRAEWMMTKICAEDFSKGMRESAVQITGALKDGLRVQMARQMDELLSSLFHVKSLQDQGKVEKPY